MSINQITLNNNGNLFIQMSSGKSININGNDTKNREIIRGVLNSRLNIINPQIGIMRNKYSEIVSMTPSEKAEMDYYIARVSHLEKERTSLLNLVDQLKMDAGNSNIVKIVTRSKLDNLKIQMKDLIRDSKIKELYPIVDQNVRMESSIYNKFILVFSSYGRLTSENALGKVPKDDFSSSLSQITFSLLSLIDELKKDDLKSDAK